MNGAPEQDPRVYLAAERTFLAWIRTGLALMGVGFAVSRFGLFLQQMRLAAVSGNSARMLQSTGLSRWSGIALVALGVFVLLSALKRHITFVRALRSGTWQPGRASRTAVTLALLLAAIGVGMAAFLTFLR